MPVVRYIFRPTLYIIIIVIIIITITIIIIILHGEVNEFSV